MEKLVIAQQKFLKSLEALNQSIQFFLKSNTQGHSEQKNAVASVVKHFELCYEMCWKFLQQHLKCNFEKEIASPKGVFRECFALKIITEKETKELLAIAEARNATTHDYDEETAQEICQRISEYYNTLFKLNRINITCYD